MSASPTARNILVLGAGPAAWRFVRAYADAAPGTIHENDRITVINNEKHIPYDRVAIEKIFVDPDKDLTLGDPELALGRGPRAPRSWTISSTAR